ncbi:hypothetical protein [Geobacter sp. SVR]|uniref:hypothetical protein n=1 Tax=Geobacter sp. SVR TaxID=2495594 RepID=UPI00143F0070|nr:hypothetical protein [Geobacter sp. SVR]BCS55169.1 hypothetical protein GSVR_34770 [Geobacter sp. SVR]GCF85350.1 hypothetical protein GSbR_19500 [Geobacter sp. SVR]
MESSNLTYKEYVRLGRDYASHLAPNCTFEEIAAAMNIASKQAAEMLCCVALGKLVYGLQTSLASDIEAYHSVKRMAL